jgi:tetratricopeptide (TPR) repeat protein
MKRQNRYINGKSGAAIGNNVRVWFKDDLQLNHDDSALFGKISEYMKGRLDLEDVRNDPALPKTEEAVKEMISDYNKNISGNKDNEKFIRDIFSEEVPEEKIFDEISHIKQEIGNSKLNEISADWVKKWHEKRQKNGGRDPHTEEIKDFITSSLKSDVSEPVKSLYDGIKKGLSRPLFVWYVSLSAAALIGAIFLVRSLLPSYNPEKLFNSYYEPMDVVSPVTRSGNSNETGSYASAIGSYKIGDYQSAATGFSEAVLKDPSLISPRFFLGLTQLALENYDQAINLLTGISGRSGEYRKEAGWYLGLAYLKTGEKEKAAECFELLAQSPGFYRERSEKILRRLK